MKDALINTLSTQIGNLITQNAYNQLVIQDLSARLQATQNTEAPQGYEPAPEPYPEAPPTQPDIGI